VLVIANRIDMTASNHKETTEKPNNNNNNNNALDEKDIALMKSYGLGPYAQSIRKLEQEVKDKLSHINQICGVKESDTGLAPPSQWDLVADRQTMQEEQPLQVCILSLKLHSSTLIFFAMIGSQMYQNNQPQHGRCK